MNIRKVNATCLELGIDYDAKKGWEQWFLLTSDWHLDNPKCDRKTLKRHLEQAKERNAKIIIFGDLFCAMQGKYDKRSNKLSLRPEHQTDNYLDSLVDTTAEFLEPYKSHIAAISPGNHETSIQGRHETDLTGRLCQQINVYKIAYSGWVVFRLRCKEMRTRTINLSYHHGYGGGGPVTKDIIQTNRKAVYLPDADIVVSGHTHDSFVFPVSRVRLKANGEQVLEQQHHIKTGNYKDEFTCGSGWAVEKGMPPKIIGSVWMRLFFERTDIQREFMMTT